MGGVVILESEKKSHEISFAKLRHYSSRSWCLSRDEDLRKGHEDLSRLDLILYTLKGVQVVDVDLGVFEL